MLMPIFSSRRAGLGWAKQLEAVGKQPYEEGRLIDPLCEKLGIIMEKMQCPVAVKRFILVKAKAIQHNQAQTESHHNQNTQIALIAGPCLQSVGQRDTFPGWGGSLLLCCRRGQREMHDSVAIVRTCARSEADPTRRKMLRAPFGL